ncbi:MAG TPA: DNA-binding response regulator, partial [Lachnospiraceae bacterium]|nr:DNA-binding response regulator [Lachnospiraceae bacterium]
SRQELLYDIWDLKNDYIDENTLNVHISSLRKKLGENGKKLETIRGFGYRFDL